MVVILPFLSKDPLKAKIPWMTFKSIKWLDDNIFPKSKVFEWGSGGSTLFFLKRCREVVSIEHDEKWYLKIKTMLVKNPKKFTYKLVPPQKGRGFKSSAKEYRGLSFSNYCKTILEYPNSYFDFVVVDGRARNDCIRLAIKKVKKWGFLILDNSEREVYIKGVKLLKNWKRLDFKGPGPINDYPWQTSVFQKIS